MLEIFQAWTYQLNLLALVLEERLCNNLVPLKRPAALSAWKEVEIFEEHQLSSSLESVPMNQLYIPDTQVSSLQIDTWKELV